uniref:Uncharacterized protein n=1 Tax=Hucho hucho TaxID=62062 RepID=A0A4W5NUK6_9TELE
MVYMIDWMEDMQVQLLSKDFGKHLLEVDDLLQKHSLQDADITVQAERVQTLNTAALKFTTIEGKTSDGYVHGSSSVRSGMCFDNNLVILREE